MALYLTKSRFKMALECPTKLYYSNSKNRYFDKNQDNDFLQALADGGNQLGELAKFKYHPDPVNAGITVETLEYEQALAETAKKLQCPTRVVVAEAALRYKTFFVRVDILIQNKENKIIELIEVKSKSVGEKEISAKFKGPRGGYFKGWLPYLYDITYQAEVARLCFPDFKIIPKLLLLDSSVECDIDSLHQQFKVLSKKDQATGRSRVHIETPNSLSRKDLGSLSILREVLVEEIVADLRLQKIKHLPHIPLEIGVDLPTFMNWAGELQDTGAKYFGGISKECKSCQFRAPASESKKSGIHECWHTAINQGMLIGDSQKVDRLVPLSIDIWGGGAGAISIAQKVLDKRRAFLSDVIEEDIKPNSLNKSYGISALERRMAQVHSVNNIGETVLINEDRLREMDDWEWPLHMIDFETSAPAIPFFKGMHAYETLAFQFSHHIMEKLPNGRIHIRHANQWISTKAEFFPSIDFVRALKNALMPDGLLKGTVTRYHNHENTVLRQIRGLLIAKREELSDCTELIDFIDLITKASDAEESDHVGTKSMVDLHRLIQEGFYSGRAGGSISLKFMLPAILEVAPQLAAQYRKSKTYGVGLTIPSLNFSLNDGHIWLQADKGNDPYKTLPPIFGPKYEGVDELIFRLAGDEVGDDDSAMINQGGLAMMAYNFTQFASLNETERNAIEAALLRYCELDTLAMVMLVQGLMELRGLPILLE